MKTYLGIDLGGTNVRIGKISAEGEVLAQVKGPSYGQEGPEKVMENLKTLVREIEGWDACAGIGIGVPGPVDTKNGTMVLSTNLPGFAGYPFAADMKKEFGLPAFLDNDANVAALGEALAGAGKGMDIVFYTTISTGIGGCLVVNGKPVSGKHGFGGEVANIIIDRNRRKVNYLNVGAIENEASGTRLKEKYENLTGETIEHTGIVFDKAEAGEEAARQIVDGFAKDLGQYFATVCCVCDPDIFILGGGMTKSADKWLDKVVEQYRAMSHEALRDTPFVLAKLEEPGIIGAAMLPVSNGL